MSHSSLEEEEYTDYSCSTAVEHLSRDVESLLRSWHIHDGCDRHFSISTDSDSITLLRAERFSWVANLPGQKSLRLELELALWDGPASLTPAKKRSSISWEAKAKEKKKNKSFRFNKRSSLSNDECLQRDVTLASTDGNYEQEKCSHLPKSLRRAEHQQPGPVASDSLFDNFSTLFGIGQHLTLTPANPLMDLKLDHMADTCTLTQKFLSSFLQRHATPNAKWALIQVVSAWLQTALNCATMSCQCCIPAFGFWGSYPSTTLPSGEYIEGETLQAKQQGCAVDFFPTWLEAALSFRLPSVSIPKRHAKRKSKRGTKSNRRMLREYLEEHDAQGIQNSHYFPAFITGTVLPVRNTGANFICSILPRPVDHGGLQLTRWATILLAHCPEDPTVVLCEARHKYIWQKTQSSHPSWRGADPKDYWKKQKSLVEDSSPGASPFLDEIERYRQLCRANALRLLEQSSGANREQPGWGPIHDPIACFHVYVTWKSERTQALLSFPYPVHSTVSELSMEQSVLDPYRTPCKFQLRTFLDRQSLESTLATTQRCVLACLVRTATLAPLTLMRHLLWEEDIIEDWDHQAGNEAALNLANEAQLGDATQCLVEILDWKTCAEEMVSQEHAEAIVKEALDGWQNFPSPPENIFSVHDQKDPLFAPIFQSAPLGRLVSDLLVGMARLRAPCSMALVWSTFCDELRKRWDAREPLPHMNYVPGLDPTPQALKERRKVFTIGVKADLAAFWKASEPDPDSQHCILGQKLQLFNIGIETIKSMEMDLQKQCGSVDSNEKICWPQGDVESPDSSSTPMPKRAASVVSLSSDMPEPPFSSPSKVSLPNENGQIFDLSSIASGKIPGELFRGNKGSGMLEKFPTETSLTGDDGGADSDSTQNEASTTSDSDSEEFFDAEECASIAFSSPSPLFTTNFPTTVVHRIERKGARCPVYGCSLVASGDQLYAPYLQRPQPLTDDLILERRLMLADHIHDAVLHNNNNKSIPVQERLEIAYRLQKPKLLSDMNAFKAANPGAVFQDFVDWYGNPENPLEDYTFDLRRGGLPLSLRNTYRSIDSTASPLDKATEAIHILNETRNFWSNTWDDAIPVAASEQKPLYDVKGAVEMTIDYLENMHPAVLLNQVLAVNLANAYFMLVTSAKDATRIDAVNESLLRLRKQIEGVLEMLAEETVNATCSFYHYTRLEDSISNFVSVETIAACEKACSYLSEAEVLVALGTSLLQKFPKQYEFVQTILKKSDGDEIELSSSEGRLSILDAISKQQQKETFSMEAVDSRPKPAFQEYLLRNLNDSTPRQLSVRYTDADVFWSSQGQNSSIEGGSLIIALTKSKEN